MPDFDMSNQNPSHKVRVNLGPSLGWTEVSVHQSRTITTAGSFNILPADCVVHVNVAGSVTILLPDVKAWVSQAAYMPATGFERALWIKDLGGNASAFPITINPFSVQTIDLQASFQIIQNRQLARLYPLTDGSGWYSG